MAPRPPPTRAALSCGHRALSQRLWERTTFPYKAPTALPRLDAPTGCSFPFSLPGCSAGLECRPCCQAPPLLHGLTPPTSIPHRGLAEEPDRLPGGLSHHGLLRSGLLKVAQCSRKSGRTPAGPALQFPSGACGDSEASGACGPVSTGKLRAHCHGALSELSAWHAKPFPVNLPSQLHLRLLPAGRVPQTLPLSPAGFLK